MYIFWRLLIQFLFIQRVEKSKEVLINKIRLAWKQTWRPPPNLFSFVWLTIGYPVIRENNEVNSGHSLVPIVWISTKNQVQSVMTYEKAKKPKKHWDIMRNDHHIMLRNKDAKESFPWHTFFQINTFSQNPTFSLILLITAIQTLG